MGRQRKGALKLDTNKHKNFQEYNDLLSVSDLMTIFGVSKTTIYKEMKNGKFGKPICIGRAFKIPRVYIWDKFFADYK